MEPERPIEKLLRAWARKRRDAAGPPLDLHPATRRVLQGEVARKFGKNERKSGSFSGLLAALWPRFALGLGVFAVLAAAAWLVLPGFNKPRSERSLAKNETALEAESVKRPAAAPVMEPASSPADMVRRADQPVREENSPAQVNKAMASRKSGQPQPAQRAALEEHGQLGDRKNIPATGGLAGVNRDGKDLSTAAGGQLSSDAFQPGHEAGTPRPGFAGGPASAARPGLPAGSPPASPESTPSMRTYGFSGNATTAGAAVAPSTASPPASPGVATTKEGLGQDGLLKKTQQDTDKSRLAYKSLDAAAAPSATRQPQVFYADETKKESKAAVQRFVQVETGVKAKAAVLDKVSPAKTVLASFELQQVGSEVRIVDGDGSVYTGFADVAGNATRLRSTNAEAPARGAAGLRTAGGNAEPRTLSLSDAEGQTGQNYSFRVTGTNRTLNQSIVFTGHLTPVTVINGITNGLRLSGGAGKLQAETQQASQPAATSRISGKAVVGDRNEVEVNAVSGGRDK